jgi:hypothetical protein
MKNNSKNRMVSCRLTPEDYERLRELSAAHSGGSVSELARVAISALLQQPPPEASAPGSLESRVVALEARVQTLSVHIRHLRGQIFPEPAQARSATAGISYDE